MEPGFGAHLRAAAAIVVPTALANALEYLPVCFAVAIVGHQSTTQQSAERIACELDALTLARAFFNIVAGAPGFGAVGAGRPRQCALALQRAVAINCPLILPLVVPLLFFSERLLLLMD
ncbi:hypothetical protein T492DRAFT_1065711 [Pavlovales sp. CCMP2436]|nr:hypothetical protein T492DRAFT_1065711 [Pavlovales sp. CCMP2436]